LLNKATETEVNKAETTVRCICLLHNIIIDREGTTHDHSVQGTAQIRGSCHAKTGISGTLFIRSSNGLADIRNAYEEYFDGPAAAILPQNK